MSGASERASGPVLQSAFLAVLAHSGWERICHKEKEMGGERTQGKEGRKGKRKGDRKERGKETGDEERMIE